MVAVGRVDVEMLGLHGGRKHHVREQRGVGQAVFEHRDVQIVAAETALHAHLIGRGRAGIRVPHHQGMDGGILRLSGQGLGQPRHVDRARRRQR